MVPESTIMDPDFIDVLLLMLLELTQDLPARQVNYHSLIQSLMQMLDAESHGEHQLFSMNQLSKATRILQIIIRNNFEPYQAVERVIDRINREVTIDRQLTQAVNQKRVVTSQRNEYLRVMFRMINHSIFKNDNHMSNATPNSRKIIDSDLFKTIMRVVPKGDETVDLAFTQLLLVMSSSLNDLPGQIPKLITLGTIP